MKVLLIGNFFAHNGSHQLSQDLAYQFSGSGWIVFVVSKYRNRIIRLLDMLFMTWRLRHQYDVGLVDIFSGQAFIWAEFVTTLLSYLKKPFVITLRGGNLPDFSRRHPLRVRRLLNRATVVTAPSDYLITQMKVYLPDIVLIPNPIDLHLYTFVSRSVPAPRLVWMRSFASIYNPLLAAEVVSLLCEDFPDTSLTMIGPDKGDGTLHMFNAKIGTLDISTRIVNLGSITKSEVPTQLQRGDIFLNTTNIDNTPVSVIEAMACGLCIISTNVGGISYLLEHERDSLLVPPEDPEAMAGAVRRILTEPGLAERLSHNARVKAECFDWAKILPQWENMLSNVINQHQHA